MPPRLSCSTAQVWVTDLSPQVIYPKSPEYRRHRLWFDSTWKARCEPLSRCLEEALRGWAKQRACLGLGPQQGCAATASSKWGSLLCLSVIWLLVYVEDQESIPSSALNAVIKLHGPMEVIKPSLTHWVTHRSLDDISMGTDLKD